MFVSSSQTSRILGCLILLFCYRSAVLAQDSRAAKTPASPITVHARHILGFPDVSRNATGDFSIQDHELRFQKPHGFLAQIPVGSIQGVTLGLQDKQVGGVPLMLAKAAAPYQSGIVVSLFSHKKYDTVTLEYFDANGAFHGAIFQLNIGRGQVLKSALEAEGAHVTRPEHEMPVRNTQETQK